MKRCEDCNFYMKLGLYGAEECRFEPVKALPLPGPGGEVRLMAYFPPTRPEAWCAKFEPTLESLQPRPAQP